MTGGEQEKAASECKRCEKWRDSALTTNPLIHFLCQHIALLPRPREHTSRQQVVPSPALENTVSFKDTQFIIPPGNPSPYSPVPIHCMQCPPTIAGGYSPAFQAIILCQNRFMNKKHMEDTLAHELIHAYDDRRFDLKWDEEKGDKGLRHLACTEIRAANLSGNCGWSRELNRFFFGFLKQQQACSRRRAIVAVQSSPLCKSEEHATRVVDEVFSSCWNDTRPLDEIYPS